MSAPARRHEAGDIPTRCPPATPPTSPGISGSPPLSGPEARLRHLPSEPDIVKQCLSEYIDSLALDVATFLGPSAAARPSSQVSPRFSIAHITRTR
jgi:hypothetical protein